MAAMQLAWSIGWPEIVVILLVVLILFGGKKLPELAKGLGRGLRLFKQELTKAEGELGDIDDKQTPAGRQDAQKKADAGATPADADDHSSSNDKRT